jgi:hypothetical protein
MSIAARVRLTLARSPWMYWAIVAVLAGAAGLFVMRAADAVDAARESWGEPRHVLVARNDVEPGGALDGYAELRQLPAPMIPADAVSELPTAAVARQRIAAGEVIVTHDVSPAVAPQALIPDSWLAVAVAEPVPTGARTGDKVTVTAGGVVLAADGVVVGTSEGVLLVAVPGSEAAQVAHGASTGDVAVLLQQ